MKFTKDHEWVSLDGDIATVGISKHAADALGDVVFVEVPEVGKIVAKGASFAVVESDLSPLPTSTPQSRARWSRPMTPCRPPRKPSTPPRKATAGSPRSRCRTSRNWTP